MRLPTRIFWYRIALNEDGFRAWIESVGVRVPEFVKRHRDVRSGGWTVRTVDGHAGVLCMSRADIVFFHDDFERKNPGSTYNPFENRNFQRIARFGAAFTNWRVSVPTAGPRAAPCDTRTATCGTLLGGPSRQPLASRKVVPLLCSLCVSTPEFGRWPAIDGAGSALPVVVVTARTTTMAAIC